MPTEEEYRAMNEVERALKKCSNCRYAFVQDTGYSNWTVTGNDFTCIKGAHPDGTFDEFYTENPKLLYAEKCPHFSYGEGFDMDVDHENQDTTLTGTQLEVYREMQAQSLIGERHWLLDQYKEQ